MLGLGGSELPTLDTLSAIVCTMFDFGTSMLRASMVRPACAAASALRLLCQLGPATALQMVREHACAAIGHADTGSRRRHFGLLVAGAHGRACEQQLARPLSPASPAAQTDCWPLSAGVNAKADWLCCGSRSSSRQSPRSSMFLCRNCTSSWAKAKLRTTASTSQAPRRKKVSPHHRGPHSATPSSSFRGPLRLVTTVPFMLPCKRARCNRAA